MDWNTGNNAIRHCPRCGRKLLKDQIEDLWSKCTDGEIAGMIENRVLCILEEDDDLVADELGYKAWEAENVDGVMFYSNYAADQFVMRHSSWVDDAVVAVSDAHGDNDCYLKMRAECNDRFLVAAFIQATEHYLYFQLEIDYNEGALTAERRKELQERIKEVHYDGGF
jgi:hypothetical protein